MDADNSPLAAKLGVKDSDLGTQSDATLAWSLETDATQDNLSLDLPGSTSFLDHRIAPREGPGNEDASGRSSMDGSKRVSRRKHDATSLLKITFAALLLLAFAGGAGHLYRMVAKRQPAERLICDAEHLKQYESDFNNSTAQLQRTLETSTDTVKQAFLRRFAPRQYGIMFPPDAVAFFDHHIKSMRAIQRPEETAEDGEKLVYALQLRLLTSIFNAASSRLSSLQELEEYGRTHPDFPIPVLDRHAESLKGSELYQQKETVSFPSFVAMLGGRDVNLKHQRKAAGQKIPEVLAHRLVNVLHADDLLDRSDREAHAAFTDFMEAATGELPLPGSVKTDPNSLPVPPGKSTFPIGLFRGALHRAEKLRAEQYVQPGDAGCWAKEWHVEGVAGVVDALEDQASDRALKAAKARIAVLGPWLEEKDPSVAFHDVFSLAVSLL